MTEIIRKTPSEFQFGDVVMIYAPFEENTPDYHNGHDVLDVLGDYVRDKFGNTAKRRPVMVIGVGDGNLTYIPLTTSTTNQYDEKYQYHVKDNSMTPKRDESIQTYAELHSVRVIHEPTGTLIYHGRLKDDDLENIKSGMNKLSSRIEPGKDKRVYMKPESREKLVQNLENIGFSRVSEMDKELFKKGPTEITIFEKTDTILYHFETSLEDVKSWYNEEAFVESVETLSTEDGLNK